MNCGNWRHFGGILVGYWWQSVAIGAASQYSLPKKRMRRNRKDSKETAQKHSEGIRSTQKESEEIRGDSDGLPPGAGAGDELQVLAFGEPLGDDEDGGGGGDVAEGHEHEDRGEQCEDEAHLRDDETGDDEEGVMTKRVTRRAR